MNNEEPEHDEFEEDFLYFLIAFAFSHYAQINDKSKEVPDNE